MKYEQSLVLFIVMLANCLAVSLDLEDTQQDIHLEVVSESSVEHKRVARNVIIQPGGGPITLIDTELIQSLVNTAQRNCVRDAMDYYNSLTHVRFVQGSTLRKDCVSINPVPAGSGCDSNIGYLGEPQVLTLPNVPVGTGCFSKFYIVHEVLHTCGMYHQQMAHNRDGFVTLMWYNIIPGKESAFVKKSASETTSFGYTCDYDSIMHYGSKVDSSNGLDTIVPKINVKIGRRTHMSSIDMLKMLAMYLATTKNC